MFTCPFGAVLTGYMEDLIVNKVAESGIVTLNMESFKPAPETLSVFDIKPFLFREMILREKDFRAALATHDWEQYRGRHVTVTCSADAIIPMWAYMLISTQLSPVAESIVSGTEQALEEQVLLRNIRGMDAAAYADKRVVIKGCGDKALPASAYVAVSEKLRPVVKSLMYGEPCSTVPVYKKK